MAQSKAKAKAKAEKAAKPKTAKPEKEQPQQPQAEQGQPEEGGPQINSGDNAAIRAEADRIKAEANYDGTLSEALLRKLEPLLYLPMPGKYIEHRAAGGGTSFDQTGVKSIQAQIDRLNCVLGQQHWRTFTRFSDGGSICRGVVIVGNDLQWARLDGEEVVPFHGLPDNTVMMAQVLLERHGFGGWKRGSNPGDIYKSSETNALKRVLARVGPAAEVYTQDFEDDPATDAPELAMQTAATTPPAPPQQPQAELTPEQAEHQIAAMMMENGQPQELLDLRAQANQAMLEMPEPPSALIRFQLLAPRAYDSHGLRGLIQRTQATLPVDSQEPQVAPAAQEKPLPPADPAAAEEQQQGVPLPADVA